MVALTGVNAVAAPTAAEAQTLQWISAEEYAAATGVSRESAASIPASGLPDRFRVRTVDGSVSEVLSEEEFTGEDLTGSGPDLDPGGGNDGKWWSVVWGGRDWNNTYVPLRLGDGNLGYRHYSVRHNLLAIDPFKAALKSRGPDAKSNYTALLVDSNLGIRETVVFGVQMATRTSDGRYVSPDGAYIGVITGYCKGKTKCPNAVNRVRVP
ncbi:hypothetical protein O7600_11420 [Micromonospora sp. WMMA1998]|uniref:hypothetical protein n=1 Tax=Micromonospora sp. WMMA1998 TaxID=3015167 RepID=UPI00248AFDA5|nr:hypothetical protein [Micromonospora sp. WMMA1998]WBC17397.1 hypothetical protein O7600_11420 [Micromonospora sp. WMMA1998]